MIYRSQTLDIISYSDGAPGAPGADAFLFEVEDSVRDLRPSGANGAFQGDELEKQSTISFSLYEGEQKIDFDSEGSNPSGYQIESISVVEGDASVRLESTGEEYFYLASMTDLEVIVKITAKITIGKENKFFSKQVKFRKIWTESEDTLQYFLTKDVKLENTTELEEETIGTDDTQEGLTLEFNTWYNHLSTDSIPLVLPSEDENLIPKGRYNLTPIVEAFEKSPFDEAVINFEKVQLTGQHKNINPTTLQIEEKKVAGDQYHTFLYFTNCSVYKGKSLSENSTCYTVNSVSDDVTNPLPFFNKETSSVQFYYEEEGGVVQFYLDESLAEECGIELSDGEKGLFLTSDEISEVEGIASTLGFQFGGIVESLEELADDGLFYLYLIENKYYLYQGKFAYISEGTKKTSATAVLIDSSQTYTSPIIDVLEDYSNEGLRTLFEKNGLLSETANINAYKWTRTKTKTVEHIGEQVKTSYIYTKAQLTESDARIVEWCKKEDTTRIDGGQIFAHSISADTLGANAIRSLNYPSKLYNSEHNGDAPDTENISVTDEPYYSGYLKEGEFPSKGSYLNLENGFFFTPGFKVYSSGEEGWKSEFKGRVVADSGFIADWSITGEGIKKTSEEDVTEPWSILFGLPKTETDEYFGLYTTYEYGNSIRNKNYNFIGYNEIRNEWIAPQKKEDGTEIEYKRRASLKSGYIELYDDIGSMQITINVGEALESIYEELQDIGIQIAGFTITKTQEA